MSGMTKNHMGDCPKLQKRRILAFHSFRTLYASCKDQGLDIARLSALAKEAYKLTRSSELEPALQRLFKTGQAARVFRQLRFIARIRAIFLCIIDCARSLPNFGKIEILPIPRCNLHNIAKNSMPYARKAALATLQEHQREVPEWMTNRQSAARFEADFYTHPLIVHAEVQLACFFDANREYTPFRYLGISKKPCHLCWMFLSEMRVFQTRPSHGQLYPHWTLPMDIEVRKQRLHSPAMILKAIERNLVDIIGQEHVTRLALLPESTAVLSARMAVSSGSPSVISSILSHRPETRHVGRETPVSLTPPLPSVLFPHRRANSLAADLPSSSQLETLDVALDDIPHQTTQLVLEFLVGLLKVLLSGMLAKTTG